jgi:hypothetical protein
MATGGSCGQTPSGCRRQCRSGESTAKSSSSSSSIASISISHLTRGRALWTSHTHGLGRVDRVQVRVGSGGDPGETLDSGRTRGRRACISRSAAQVTIGRASSIRASVGGGRRRVVIVLSGARAEDSSDDGTGDNEQGDRKANTEPLGLRLLWRGVAVPIAVSKPWKWMIRSDTKISSDELQTDGPFETGQGKQCPVEDIVVALLPFLQL